MKTLFKKILMLAAVAVIAAGCAGPVQYRDKYTFMMPDDNLLQNREVPPPPYTPQAYKTLTCDEKESMSISYITDLLNVIAKEQADKAGLRAWKANVAAQADAMNKKAESDVGNN